MFQKKTPYIKISTSKGIKYINTKNQEITRQILIQRAINVHRNPRLITWLKSDEFLQEFVEWAIKQKSGFWNGT